MGAILGEADLKENWVSRLHCPCLTACLCGMSQQESRSVAGSLAVNSEQAATGFLEVLLGHIKA